MGVIKGGLKTKKGIKGPTFGENNQID